MFACCYRPQRRWAKVIFSQACVKNSVHRGGRVSASVHAGIPPPGPGTSPPEQTPPDQAHPPGADTPFRSRPPREADCSIRSTSGWYASYWNAFLLVSVNGPCKSPMRTDLFVQTALSHFVFRSRYTYSHRGFHSCITCQSEEMRVELLAA